VKKRRKCFAMDPPDFQGCLGDVVARDELRESRVSWVAESVSCRTVVSAGHEAGNHEKAKQRACREDQMAARGTDHECPLVVHLDGIVSMFGLKRPRFVNTIYIADEKYSES